MITLKKNNVPTKPGNYVRAFNGCVYAKKGWVAYVYEKLDDDFYYRDEAGYEHHVSVPHYWSDELGPIEFDDHIPDAGKKVESEPSKTVEPPPTEIKPGQRWRDKKGKSHYVYRVTGCGDAWIAWGGPHVEACGTKEFVQTWLNEHATLQEER